MPAWLWCPEHLQGVEHGGGDVLVLDGLFCPNSEVCGFLAIVKASEQDSGSGSRATCGASVGAGSRASSGRFLSRSGGG